VQGVARARHVGDLHRQAADGLPLGGY
jgi:hypothetical protein